jgi:NDP-sugar pyrophosphorylase family protein
VTPSIPRTAFLLGAGLGTRLRPLTDNLPKPLLPVAGRPMIFHAMDKLLAAGVSRFIINTHHCPEAYTRAFPDAAYRGVPLTLVHEPVLLDTGGGLKNIEPLLPSGERTIFVCNGDIFAEPDYARLFAAHNAAPAAEVTLLLRSKGTPRNVRFDTATGAVLDMRSRLGAAGGIACLFSGIYCMNREFFAALQAGKIESVVEAFLRRIAAAPGSIGGLLDDSGPWHDLGTVEEYMRVQS